MSGPLDRPSFSDPDDLEQPSQDRESRSPEAQPAEPWSPADPWRETRREGQGWDDWPPASPPPDDYYVEPGPSQDLWAESWDDEAASTLPRSGYEPVSFEEEAFDEAPIAQAPITEAPIAESPIAEAPIADAPSDEVSDPLQPPSRGDGQGPVAEPAPPPAPAPEAVLPDWLAEPPPEQAPADVASPPFRSGPEAPEREVVEPVEGMREDEDGRASDESAVEPDVPSWLDVGPQYALPPFLETDEIESAPGRPEPEAAPEPDVTPAPDLTPAPDAAHEPGSADEADAERAATPVASWDPDAAAERWQAWEATAPSSVDVAPPLPEATPEPAPLWEPDATPDEAAVEPPPAEPVTETPPDAPTEEPAASDDGWEPSGWSDADEATRVLPTDWTPPPPPVIPPPMPPTEVSEGEPALEPTAGTIRTGLSEPDADLEPEPDSTTAEQAVPWLIGLILLLAGMVIVLLALIFAGPQSLGAPSPSPSASAAGGLPSLRPSPSATVAPSASATAAPTPTPVPPPEYGPLEMVYQGRSAALAPIYLLLHDFTTEDEEVVLAQDPAIDVRRFAWAPDGTVGAGLLADILVSIEQGESKRNLGEGLMTITFGADASMVYAVRVTADGGDDVATILAVDFVSGDASELASVTYPRPSIGAEAPLPEAQFSDDGGTVRLFWMSDGSLRLWVLGASTWQIDAESGDVTDLESEELPLLVDPDNTHRIDLVAADDNAETTVRYLDADGDELATTTAPGLVSHLRWSRGGDRVVFTVGRSASGGGILQDLFLWDLEAGVAPTQITNTGAAFGAEWRGAAPRWEPA